MNKEVKASLQLAGIWIAAVLFILLLLGIATNATRLGTFLSNSFFAPKEEALRREVVEQSKAYRDGVIQDLNQLRIDYAKADPEVKPALASAIRHRAAGLPEQDMPADIAAFVRSLP